MAQIIWANMAHICIINHDNAGIGLVQTGQQTQQSRFARADTPQNSHPLSGRNIKRYILQRWAFLALISEMHMTKSNIAIELFALQPTGTRFFIGLSRQHFSETAIGSQRLVHAPQKLRQLTQRRQCSA